jgi:hypothetical protein
MIGAIIGAVIGAKLGRRYGEKLGYAVEAEIARQVAVQMSGPDGQTVQAPTMAAAVPYPGGDTLPGPELLAPPDWSFIRP